MVASTLSTERRMLLCGLAATAAVIALKIAFGEPLVYGLEIVFEGYGNGLLIPYLLRDVWIYGGATYLLVSYFFPASQSSHTRKKGYQLALIVTLGGLSSWLVAWWCAYLGKFQYAFPLPLIVLWVPVAIQFLGGTAMNAIWQPFPNSTITRRAAKAFCATVIVLYGGVFYIGSAHYYKGDLMGELILAFVILVLLRAQLEGMVEWMMAPEADEPTDDYTLIKTGLVQADGTPNPRGIPIGYYPDINGHWQLMVYDETGEKGQLMTIGSTGSGKGATMLIPALLNAKNNSSAVVIDVKGQLASVTIMERLKLGHKVAVLNPFNELKIPSATYNPLSCLDITSPDFFADCGNIARSIVDDVKESNHWEISALNLVRLCLMHVAVTYKGQERTLGTVSTLITAMQNEAARKEILNDMAKSSLEEIQDGAMQFYSNTDGTQDVITTAGRSMKFLTDRTIQKVLRGGDNEINFADLKKRLQTVYVCIPPRRLEDYAQFLRLVTICAYHELEAERTLPLAPVMFMLDEFTNLGRLPFISRAANIGRDYKIRLWFVAQNLPDLIKVYPHEWESLLSSSGLIQTFGFGKDRETASFFSSISGMRKEKRVSTSMSTNVSTNSGGGSSGSNSGLNIHEVDVPTFKPEQLRDLEDHEQVIFTKNRSDAFKASRLAYFYKTSSGATLYEGGYDKDYYQMSTEERQGFERRAAAGEWWIKQDGWGKL